MKIGEVRHTGRQARSAAIPTHAAAPWPHVPATTRRARRTGIGLLLAFATVITALWAVPPLLDWNRFRTTIAAIAGGELGRKVVIGGDVTLRLLPQAVLTANDVTVPDGGDGISARIASLRLEIGLIPLLAGRIVVHDLVVGSAVLNLPWPPPNGLANPARPHIPHPFAAHVENGTLRAGQAEITGITAAIHGGPVPTDAPDAGPVASFGAEGFAAFDGQRWRFTTALGAPDADGVSAIDLAVHGQGPASETGGAIQGTLANGVLQGRLNAAGSDLSLLMPASAQAWRAAAPFTASGDRIESDAVSLSLGGAPASAAFTLQLAEPTRFDAHLHAASLDLDAWSRLLSGKFAAFTPPAIPIRLDLSAGGGSLLGGTLGALSGTLTVNGPRATIGNVEAILPGGARLHFDGKLQRGPRAVLTVDGPATLDAPDLHATLAWLRPLAPSLFGALPAAVLRTARLAGTTHLIPGRLSVTQMEGQLDGAKLSGALDLAFDAHPKLSADARLDHLAIDDWLRGAPFQPGMKLEDAAKPFTRMEAALRLEAASASWAGKTLTDLSLAATTGAGGLTLSHASASLPEGTVALSGTLAADGTLSGLKAHASTPEVARLIAGLPAGWHWPTVPWTGPAELTVSADGPPAALDVQLRAETSDVVLEADHRRDTLTGAADTTLTLRHPGAPFLLAALGITGSDAWLGMGSLALLAHLHSTPSVVGINDFTLDAADLHLQGHGDLRLANNRPSLTLDLHAGQLPLPSPAQLSAAALPSLLLPADWQTSIHLAAAQVEIGQHDAAQDVTADLAAAQRNVVLDITKATVAGGVLSAQLAVDASQKPAASAVRAGLTKASIGGPLTGWPLDIASATADIDADLQASGSDVAATLASLSGEAHVSLRNTTLAGLSLTLLDRAPSTRAAVQTALTTGETNGLSGGADLVLDHGHAAIANASLSSTEGSLTAAGTFDIPAHRIDLQLAATSALPGSPPYAMKLSGTKLTVDLGKPTQGTAKTKRRRK